MNRRNFIYSVSFAAATIMSGCESQSNKEKKNIQTPQKSLNNKTIDNLTPFTQKLKIPKQIDFEDIAKAKFKAQKNHLPIYPNKNTEVMTFQGSLPSPTIRIQDGDDFELDFTNNLEKPTIIHWHGLIIPEDMDGHPKDAIPNKATKEYKYKLKQRAGTYWYHTHPHGRTGEEIYYGLAGLYIVENEKEKLLNLPSGEFEIPLIIQDRRFDKNGNLIYKQTAQDNNGVLGDVIMVNSTPFPYKNIKNTKISS